MTNDDRLLKAILDDPDDDAVRLVYSDWLEEQGDVARAEFIRAGVELAALDHDLGLCGRPNCEKCDLAIPLTHKQRQLLTGNGTTWAGRAVITACEVGFGWEWERGFVHEIRCTGNAWVANADGILASHPVRYVYFLLRPTIERRPDPNGGYLANLKGANPNRWYGIDCEDRYILPHLLAANWPDVTFRIPTY